VRELSKATAPDDAVFTIINGKPAKYLYSDTVQALLVEADLRMGPNGIPRSTYCFRHTYATFRLRARFKSLSCVAVSCGSACEHTDAGDVRPSG